jgi:hypothetical protein
MAASYFRASLPCRRRKTFERVSVVPWKNFASCVRDISIISPNDGNWYTWLFQKQSLVSSSLTLGICYDGDNVLYHEEEA